MQERNKENLCSNESESESRSQSTNAVIDNWKSFNKGFPSITIVSKTRVHTDARTQA